jgi:hypothetical protein
MKTYKGDITKLESNQIFVFGSNTQGRHGKGAALFAKNNCGAKYGQARGPQGQSYAICTKDLTKRLHPSVSYDEIVNQIKELYRYAKEHPDKEFLVPYKSSSRNLNAYSPEDLATMFYMEEIPDNIVFEEGFAELIKTYSIEIECDI